MKVICKDSFKLEFEESPSIINAYEITKYSRSIKGAAPCVRETYYKVYDNINKKFIIIKDANGKWTDEFSPKQKKNFERIVIKNMTCSIQSQVGKENYYEV